MPSKHAPSRWTPRASLAWQKEHPWLVGCNYMPQNAINQLEMWQVETFDEKMIDTELGWAKSLGFNSVRVFLHDLLWHQDAKGFLKRIDRFLSIAKKRGIGAMIVFFDSCWHPFPHPGKQRDPEPGVHNSYWLQSPGLTVLRDPAAFDRLEDYVTGVVKHFADDPRVQVWDIWNEPDNPNHASRGTRDLGHRKADIVAPLMSRAFDWARAGKPSQPLTTGIWLGDWRSDDSLRMFEKLQIDLSDVVSFHCYGHPDDLETRINQLRRFGRPLLCTEYMARGPGSTFEGSLPLLKEHHVGAYNWGFVQGKSQTYFPWDSWQHPYPPEPALWFHDIFRSDGTPYRQDEVDFIRSVTGKA